MQNLMNGTREEKDVKNEKSGKFANYTVGNLNHIVFKGEIMAIYQWIVENIFQTHCSTPSTNITMRYFAVGVLQLHPDRSIFCEENPKFFISSMSSLDTSFLIIVCASYFA